MRAQCFVYFIQAGDGGHIKIGISRNVQSRLSKMQTDSPARLSVLAVIKGDERDEAEIHRRLADFRVSGEWFHPHNNVLSLIEAEKARAGTNDWIICANDREPCCALQAWRWKENLTTEQLAAMTGTTSTSISRIENGKQRPSWDLLEAFHRVSGGLVQPNDFAPFMRQAKCEAA